MLLAMFGTNCIPGKIINVNYQEFILLWTLEITKQLYLKIFLEICLVQIAGIAENVKCYVRPRVHEDVFYIAEGEMFGTNCIAGSSGMPQAI